MVEAVAAADGIVTPENDERTAWTSIDGQAPRVATRGIRVGGHVPADATACLACHHADPGCVYVSRLPRARARACLRDEPRRRLPHFGGGEARRSARL